VRGGKGGGVGVDFVEDGVVVADELAVVGEDFLGHGGAGALDGVEGFVEAAQAVEDPGEGVEVGVVGGGGLEGGLDEGEGVVEAFVAKGEDVGEVVGGGVAAGGVLEEGFELGDGFVAVAGRVEDGDVEEAAVVGEGVGLAAGEGEGGFEFAEGGGIGACELGEEEVGTGEPGSLAERARRVAA